MMFCFFKKGSIIKEERRDTMKVRVGISNHHVHLKQEDLEQLFGKEYSLTPKRQLKQPGQFASEETVTLKTNKSSIEKVRVLGPVREYTQVEISKTDAIKLGLQPPVRDSKDIKGSESITIIGPKGTINLEEGCILATRHIHISEKDAKKYGYQNDSTLSVKVHTEKGGILENVHIKIADPSYFELHLDTDDANAFLLKNEDEVEIIHESNSNL